MALDRPFSMAPTNRFGVQNMSQGISMDPDRRKWLAASSVAGGVGLIATSVPFVASMAPSERARARGAPVELDPHDFATGELRTVAWRGKPVFVLRRSPETMVAVARHDDLLVDPSSLRSEQPGHAQNIDRSVKPDFSVMVGLCTHLGCIPTFRPTPGAPDLDANWPGGFFWPLPRLEIRPCRAPVQERAGPPQTPKSLLTTSTVTTGC